ncbi:MAG: VacJ family lipoprotein [Sphingomonadales bacterium]|nr:VacJ family lipoprotein [Sphingomonadales bacterium]
MLLMVLALAEATTGAIAAGPLPPAVGATQPALQPAPHIAEVAVLDPPPGASPAPADAAPAVPAASPGSAAAQDAAGAAANSAGTDSAGLAGTSFVVHDPWVKINRSIWRFDTTLEKALLAPVAHGYNYVVPHGVRFHVTNALYNLGEPVTAVNDLLQLRIGAMGRAVGRFVINSTIGIAGLFDVAAGSGIPRHRSDFGQTLGRYGVGAGNYVMLPFLGPSDVRDGIGSLVDSFIDPVELLVGGITSPEGISLFVLEGVDWRSRSDDTLNAIYTATDPYAFARAAYLQTRVARIDEATGRTEVLPDFDAPSGTP